MILLIIEFPDERIPSRSRTQRDHLHAWFRKEAEAVAVKEHLNGRVEADISPSSICPRCGARNT